MRLFPLEVAFLPSMFVSAQPVASLTSPHSAERPNLQTVFITPTLQSRHPFDYSKARMVVGLVTAHFLSVDLGLLSNVLTQSRAPCENAFQRLSSIRTRHSKNLPGRDVPTAYIFFSLFPSLRCYKKGAQVTTSDPHPL